MKDLFQATDFNNGPDTDCVAWSTIPNVKLGGPTPRQKGRGLVPAAPRFRHPCLPIKREEMMIYSEKRKLLHDYYQSHILFH